MSRKRRSYSYDEYKKAMQMLNKGVGPTKVSRELDIPKPTVKRWKYKGEKPPLARWIPKPSKELAYIIGVLYGDGSLYINRHCYKIQLMVNDYEFAEIFSKNMARLLNKKYVKPKWNKIENRWVAIYFSKAFYTWYKQQNLDTLKPYIEYSRETVANFLRGLYDSDGGHYIYKKKRYSRIHLSNNNKDLLRYVQHLLEKYFGINATGPYISTKAGTENEMRNGKTAKTNHNNYLIVISRRQYTEKFLSMIGFSIEEKQLGLPRRK